MPKSQFLDPKKVRRRSSVRPKAIPVNSYRRTFADEVKRYSKKSLIAIYHDMAVIREFEEMLNQIKIAGEYQGIAYNYPGPAHLSIGQEASAVGQAYVLTIDDFIFGSHRSHGEILAKGLSTIAKTDDARLQSIMEGHLGGETLRVVEREKHDTAKSLAIDFLLYGALAEIYGRRTGLNRGLGGSMHAFFQGFGIYPNNAIVGGSADISVGAALFKKINRKSGVVVCNIGDASLGCGPVWEAICMATMGQYNTLWSGDVSGGLPLIINFMDNMYGMGGQTAGETMGQDFLARVGAGVNSDQMHAERVDGYNPFAVIDAFERKIKILARKKGPVLLDTLTYRVSGHSPSDASSYREREEIAAWQAIDPVKSLRSDLIQNQVCTDNELDALDASITQRMVRAMKLAIDDSLSPRLDPKHDADAVGRFMYSNTCVTALGEGECEVLLPREENPRVQQIAKRSRSGLDAAGQPLAKGKAVQFRDALFEAILDGFYTDPTMAAWGEENRDWGGAFAVYRGLTESLPYHRLFNSPISEAAIVGAAVGYGMCGGRVVAELMYCDFLGRAGDEVFNQLSKWQAMSAGILKMPVIIRVSVGAKYGAQHSQDFSSLCAHIPGLQVMFPATPYDAKGLMNAALRRTDPVVFFESQRSYDLAELFRPEGVPEGFYEVEIGMPDVKREGKDITIVTAGHTLYTAVAAADILRDAHGLQAELIDLRTLVPLNYGPIIESVKKTGRVVLSSDACQRGSFMNDVAQNIAELAFDYLDAPPVVVGSRNWITPSHELEGDFFPQPSWLIDAIHERILPLPGYTAGRDFSDAEKLRLGRLGI